MKPDLVVIAVIFMVAMSWLWILKIAMP